MVRAAADLTAIGLIGDGVVGALTPRRHVRRYEIGPRVWQDAMRAFARRPALTRSLAVSEAAAGLMLAIALARSER